MSSILTETDVRRLRDLAARKLLNVRQEAMFHGCSAETIRRAVRGETFTKLTMAPPKSEVELEAEAAASLERFQKALKLEKDRQELPEKMLKEMAEEPADTPFTNRNLAKEKGYL